MTISSGAAAVGAGCAGGQVDEGLVGDAVGARVGIELDSPLLLHRAQSFWTPRLWRSSVVRM